MKELDKIYKEFGDGPLDYMYFKFNLDFIQDRLKNKNVLELSTNIYSTLELARLAKDVVTVDGSGKKIDDLAKVIIKRKVDNVLCIQAYFEDWLLNPVKKFDEVVLFRALEHIEDPVKVLSLVRKHVLNKKGHITICVPNGASLHRRLGVKLGMLPTETTLSDADLIKGHKRVYTVATLSKDLKKAGFKVDFISGSFLKTVNDAEIKRNMQFYNPKMNQALFELSKDLPPEFGAEILVRATI